VINYQVTKQGVGHSMFLNQYPGSSLQLKKSNLFYILSSRSNTLKSHPSSLKYENAMKGLKKEKRKVIRF